MGFFQGRRWKRLKWLLINILAMGCTGCTTVVAGKKVSASGFVMLGHNEDNLKGKMTTLYSVPRRNHPKGEWIEMNGGGRVAQVDTTWAYLWSETPNERFSDFYLNEWRVVVTSNSAATKEQDLQLLKETGQIVDGGIDYWLRRLVAERARTAREGLDIALSLVEKFGYNASGRMYTIADREEAWVVQLIAGKHYFARRVPDDEVAVIPNNLIMGEIDSQDRGEVIVSDDIQAYAVARGWYQPDTPFQFDRVFELNGKGILSEEGFDNRHWAGQRILLEREPNPGPLPFSIKPARPVTIDVIKRVLRNHQQGGMGEANPGWPHHVDQEKDRAICHDTSRESLIVEYGNRLPDGMDTLLWRAQGYPCSSIYVPFFLGIRSIPQGYSLLDPEEAIATHFNRDETVLADGRNSFYRFDALCKWVDEEYRSRSPEIQEQVRIFEEGMEKEVRGFLRQLPDHASAASHSPAWDRERILEELEAFTEKACQKALAWVEAQLRKTSFCRGIE